MERDENTRAQGHKRGWNAAELEDMILSYRQGESLHSLADRYGVTPESVRWWLKRYGVPIRSAAHTRLTNAEDARLHAIARAEPPDA